jgi:catechol 2,3-dioxygenase-like lactoylglutathione lyase family enzyme
MDRMHTAFIDHLNIPVQDLARSRRFYEVALGPLGARVTEIPGPPLGWGPALVVGPPEREDLCLVPGRSAAPLHFAFEAETRAAVRAFHTAALGAGGRDNGAPGLRPRYSARYFAAFVIDPDGYNVEVVTRAAEE